MADKRITQIATTYDRDNLALATDYLIGDRSGGSSFRILAEEVVHGVLENTADPIIIASDVNVGSGALFVDVSGNKVGVGTSSPSEEIHVSVSQNNVTRVRVENGNSGTAALADFLAVSDGADLALQAFSTGYSGSALGTTLADKARIRTGTGTQGLLIHTSGPYPVIFGTNDTIRMTIDNGNFVRFEGFIAIADGVTAPATSAGYARIYVDAADGDLKVKFGNGHVATIATDS